MNYIALLDHDHLGNNLFLKSFAEAISRQKNAQGIILHGDSEYTDTIIQEGVMREDARFRSTRELNTRLIALLADSNVPAIGLNGFQKEIISYDPESEELTIKKSVINSLPNQVLLVLSNLITFKNSEVPQPFSLARLAEELMNKLQYDELFVFKKGEEDEIIVKNDLPEQLYWNELDENFKKNYLPDEIRELCCTFNLISSRTFMYVSDNNKYTKIIMK